MPQRRRRKLRQPAHQQPHQPPAHQVVEVHVQLGDRLVGIARADQMVDGRDRLVDRQIPVRRRAMQSACRAGALVLQDILQEAGEQAVVAEPALLLVRREDEQVGAQQAIDGRLGVVAAGQRIAERRAEAVEYAGLQQEAAAVLALLGEDLLGQIGGQVQVRTGEGLDEGRRILAPFQGQRRQVERGDPALGAVMQGGDIGRAELQAVILAQEGRGLVQAEAQGARIDFQQLPARADTANADFRRGARRYHQAPVWRQRGQQLLDEIEHRGALDHLEFVEQDGKRPGLACDAFQQRIDRLHIAEDATLDEPFRGQFRHAGIEPGNETRQVVVGRLQAQPGGLPAGSPATFAVLAQQGGLAETGRGANQHEFRGAGVLHLLQQLLTNQAGGLHGFPGRTRGGVLAPNGGIGRSERVLVLRHVISSSLAIHGARTADGCSWAKAHSATLAGARLSAICSARATRARTQTSSAATFIFSDDCSAAQAG
ncbi:hypothetical protein D3C81_999770 [compost metagenome]